MDNPKLYYKYNRMQRHGAAEVIDEYLDLITWQCHGGDVILDIGCGTGDTTSEVLIPRLPSNFRKLVGVDICESMVEFARANYVSPNLEFDLLDIGTRKLPEKYKQKFHHAFSFFCLHWIQQQKQVMQNIYDLLQPGGDVLLVILAHHPTFDIYSTLSKMDKWKTHIVNIHDYVTPYQNVKNPEDILRTMFETIGFQVHACDLKIKTYEYENLNCLLKSMIAVNPYYSQMTDYMKKQYVVDYTNEILKTNFYQESRKNKNDSIFMPYRIIVICASKPISIV